MRTVHGRLLLRPSPRLNELIVGVLGRAQRRYQMPIVAVTCMSNHLHIDCLPRDAPHLARFMQYALSKLAREVGRLHDWRERIWSRRYRAIPISDEPDAQTERLSYLLSNGVKERLVEDPRHWPGVHSADALLGGAALSGVWVDRTQLYQASRRGEPLDPRDAESRETLVLSPLPCWAHLSAAEQRQRVAAMIDEIVAVGRAERRGRAVLGPERILRQDPHQRPKTSDHSPAPLVHAASKAMRIAMKAAYRAFLDAYRFAADQLRAGVRDAVFPRGCFPPPMPAIALRPG